MIKLLCPSICTNAGTGRIRYKGACFHYSGSVVALSLSSHGSRGEIPLILCSKRFLHYFKQKMNDLLKCTQSLKEFQMFFALINANDNLGPSRDYVFFSWSCPLFSLLAWAFLLRVLSIKSLNIIFSIILILLVIITILVLIIITRYCEPRPSTGPPHPRPWRSCSDPTRSRLSPSGGVVEKNSELEKTSPLSITPGLL